MTLDPKALEAALNTPIDEIRKVLERAFDAADLVSRRDYNWSQEPAATKPAGKPRLGKRILRNGCLNMYTKKFVI